MILLNEQIFIDVSYLATEEQLKQLDEEICLGLACAKNVCMSVGFEASRGDAALELFDPRFKDVKYAMDELKPWEKEKMQTFTHYEKQKYLKIAKGAYFPWAVLYSLLSNSSWNDKMKAEGKTITEEAQTLFPNLLKWCYGLPIFQSIGRICIFGVDPSQHITCHRDLDPKKWELDDEFIMVSPRGDKKFYVYDSENNKKHYPSSKIYMFHDLNYHGVEPSPFFTYSFRIDGKFTEEFKSKIKVKRNL